MKGLKKSLKNVNTEKEAVELERDYLKEKNAELEEETKK